jgi:radical SAM superfamily enzyme YgiQ (UPF0313 family)
MQILLLSMPDSFEHTPALAIRMPNGALASLAGNIDPPHRITIADLVLAQSDVRGTLERLVRTLRPDLVGLSVMTFQRASARRIISLVRALQPQVRIVVGGYDPSLAPESWIDPAIGVDVIVRGEGELTFRALVNALHQGRSLEKVDGLWFRDGEGFRRNPPRSIASIEKDVIRLPDRSARVLTGYTMLGRPIDVVETSRGCTYDCTFCSIIEMRGRNFHRFALDRVIADIRDARDRGARAVFLVDDNIMLDVQRFESLCRAIVAAGLHDVDYLVQAMTSTMATHGATLAPLMREAGFRYVFLGIENILEQDLRFLRASAKNRRRSGSRVSNASLEAVDIIHRHGMLVVGGLIVGNPDDTREAIAANLAFARQHIDWPYIQHPTPYPGTPMTRDFVERSLIVNPRVEEYDGTTAVAHTTHLAPEEIEFMRWTAERWMKVRHLPTAFRHDPWFVLANWHRMLRHTFRGSTWRSVLGLESARQVFRRYRSLRARERELVDWPDPLDHPAREGHTPSESRWSAAAARTMALLLSVLLAPCVFAVEWPRLEGPSHTFPSVFTLEGGKLADGEFVQEVDGDRLLVRIVSAFEDGRCIEERAVFRQRPELIQDEWVWREARSGVMERSFHIDFAAGTATASKLEAGRLRRWADEAEVDPGRAFAGFGFALALKGLRERLTGGEQVELQAVGFSPRPRVVTVEVSFEKIAQLAFGDRTVEGDQFVIRPDLPWVVGLFVDVPDSRIWLGHAMPFEFLRWEGFLAEPSDPVVRVDAILPGGAGTRSPCVLPAA